MGVRQSVFAAAILAAAMGAAPAFGLVVTGSSTTGNTVTSISGYSTASAYASVGTVNDCSCVYLGNGWVITAAHVGSGATTTFTTTSGTTVSYSLVENSTVSYTNSDGSTADFVLYQISGDTSSLSAASISPTSVSYNATLYSVGYGLTRSSSPTYYTYNSSTGVWTSSSTYTPGSYTGYTYSDAAKAAGTNNVSNYLGDSSDGVITSVTANGHTSDVFTYSFTANNSNEAIVASGDSGGGVFAVVDGKLTLVGLNILLYTNDTQPSGTAISGNYSGAVSLASYYTFISSVIATVPEPTSVALLGLGGAALLARRRR